jgi:hypothetical protein
MTRLLVALAWVGCAERALPLEESARLPDLARPVMVDAGGTLDFAMAMGSPDLAQPGGVFSDAILGAQLISQPWSITVADVDHDGHPDALVGLVDTAGVLYGVGDGTFSGFEDFKLYNSHQVIAADLDGDGWEELLVAQAGNLGMMEGGVVILHGVKGHGFVVDRVLQPGTHFYGVHAADLNADGHLDVLAVSADGDFEFLAGPAFASAAIQGSVDSIYRMDWGDFDGDGLADCFAIDGSSGAPPIGHGILARGAADGFALPAATYGSVGYPAVGDVDGDGRADVMVVDMQNTDVQVLIGGNGGFQAPIGGQLVHAYAYAAAAGDLDGDGLADLVTTHGNFVNGDRRDFVDVYRSDGHGGLTSMALLMGIGYPYDAAAIADVDSDGRNDILVGDRFSKVITTFLNR